MDETKSTFWARFGGALTFALIALAGVLVTYFIAGAKYQMVEGQEVLIREGSTIKAILMGVGTLVIAFFISRKV